jgi:hypothetical protein
LSLPLLGKETLQGLMEALNLAAGLRVMGPRVLGVDAQNEQLRLERGEAVAVGGGEHAAVVGQKRCRQAPSCAGLVEGRDDLG